MSLNSAFAFTKRVVGDLALFGGEPAFSRAMYVTRPGAPDRQQFFRLAGDAWDRRWFTNDGPLTQELERRLESRLGVAHCVLTNNGTAAMSLLIQALGLGGEVILPSFTFISTAHALSLSGVEPVFADVESEGWDLDLAQCERLVTPRTTALIATHLFGSTCKVRELEAFCRERGIKLIFDSAHAFGCTSGGQSVGGFGDAEVFSFHATKAFHTFEGGAITTQDSTLADKLRKLRNFGFDENGHVTMVGTNAKMSEIHAAMGLVNLDEFDQTMAASRACHEAYQRHLSGASGLKVNAPDSAETSNHHYVVADVDAETLGLTRDQLLQVLHAENVVARRYFHPGAHRSEPYASRYAAKRDALPCTDRLNARLIQLPGGSTVSGAEAAAICSLLRFAAAHAPTISERLQARAP